ncbi:MAG: TonB-dependent receptor [Daejeonella sp.]
MQLKAKLRFPVLVLFFSLLSITLYAQQTGKIVGKVTDKKTGETLIGLSVKVSGSSAGTSTDIEGRFVLANLTPGKYSLTLSYVGYQPKNITDIDIAEGKTEVLDVVMEEASTQELSEVVITSTAHQESISGLFARQKTNISISDGISSDQIKRSPDRNTSEVLKRVSGTSIQDNKFVIVRGLSDRYNSTMLNNAVLPSTEPDKKAFSFDIIPSSLIDNIIINKTASAELPGDFSGGLVQVITKDIPDQNFISLQTGLGYNSQSTFNKFRLSDRGKYELLGYTDQESSIPKGIPSTNRYRTYTNDEKISAGKLFLNRYNINNFNSSFPSQSLQANLGLTHRFEDDANFGVILSLTYRNGESITKAERFDYESSQQQFDFKDKVFKSGSSVGALANLAFIKGKNKFAFKNIYNISADNSYTERTGVQFFEKDSIRGFSSDLVSKSLLNSQLEGEHKLNWKDIKVNWNLNYTYSDRLQPDLKSTNYRLDYDQGATEYEAIVPNGTASRTDASRFFSAMFEDSYGGSTNITLPFTFLKEKSNLKLGAFKQYKLRDFSARKFGYIKSFGSFDASLLYLPYNQIFDPVNVNSNGFIMDEGTENSDRYDAKSDINAAYIQLDNKFGSKTRVIWGARIEDAYQSVNTFDFSGAKLKVENTYLDILPSLNATYSLSEKVNIRFSASQTVTRPELRELANFGFFDYVSKRILQGNPDLKRSQNTNLDLKYELYPGNGQIVSVSGFYKYFKNPIEQIVSSGSVKNITFQNANSATTYGFEVEFRKKLNFLNGGEFLNNLVAYANASVIISTVNLNSLVSEITSRSLQGQSPYLVNAGLQYSNIQNGLSFNLLYNRIGNRIAEVGYQGYPDVYEKGRNVVDFQISRKVLKAKGELRLNLSDILNEKILFYQNLDDHKTYQAENDNILNTARVGRGASLSFIYNFSLNRK